MLSTKNKGRPKVLLNLRTWNMSRLIWYFSLLGFDKNELQYLTIVE